MPSVSKEDLRAALAFLGEGNWRSAHEIVQKDEQSPLACWAHGIVHLMEGDTANARYWYREAGRPFPGDAALALEVEAFEKEIARLG